MKSIWDQTIEEAVIIKGKFLSENNMIIVRYGGDTQISELLDHYDDDAQIVLLYEYCDDVLSFTTDEFIGLTVRQALEWCQDREIDYEYLKS